MKTPEDSTAPAAAPAPAFIRLIPRLHLAPWPEQPRQHFTPERDAELRQSMEQHGFQPAWPLLCRPLEFEAEAPRVTNGYHLRYRTHPASPWRPVQQDFTFPPDAPWRMLLTQDDLDQALKWLPKFQIVDGERRWHRSGEVHIHEVPCVVREMTDSEALELALVSALQKEELNVMEEADGFRRLLEARNEKGELLHTRKSLALKLGRSEPVIGRRVMLCALRGTAAGKAAASGELPEYQAYTIARLPTASLREEWAKKVLQNPWGPSPMPRLQLDEKLQKEVLKEIRGGKFDASDKNLVPVVHDEASGARLRGGACADCPFNTRNMEAEPDAPRSRVHMCMNPGCFQEKEVAAFEQWRMGAVAPAKNIDTLAHAENDQLWADSGEVLAFNSPYVELEERPGESDVKPTAQNVEPWKKLVAGVPVPVIAARDEKGRTHLLVRKDLAIAAAQENKHRIFKKDAEEATAPAAADSPIDRAAESMHRETAAKTDRAAEEAEQQRKERVWLAKTGALVQVMAARKTPADGLFAMLYGVFKSFFVDGRSVAADRRGVNADDFEKSWVKGHEPSYAAALVEIMLQQAWWEDGEDTATAAMLAGIAKSYGLNLKQVEKDTLGTIKLEQKEAAEKVAVEEGVEWKARHEDVDHFTFSSQHVAENPDRCELHFPKAAKTNASVSVARMRDGWVTGWFVQGPKFGTSAPCSQTGTKYGSRELALRTGLLAIMQQVPAGNEPVIGRLDAWIAALAAPKDKPKKTKATSKGAR